MSVYLAGPIFGCTDDEAKGWRETASLLLGGDVIDPMDRDYRGIEDLSTSMVDADLSAIRESTAVLAYALRPSWGTAMEIRHAWAMGKRVVAVVGDGPVSPWLRYHTDGAVYRTLDLACAVLLRIAA